MNNKFHIFELTAPLDVNISQRNIDKTSKYAHFAIDITCINTTVTAFEIWAQLSNEYRANEQAGDRAEGKFESQYKEENVCVKKIALIARS